MKNLKIISYSILAIAIAPAFASGQAKTIGDILGKIKQQSKKIQLQKDKTSLPEFKGYGKRLKVDVQEVRPPRSESIKRDEGPPSQLEKYTDAEIEQLYLITKKHKKSKARGEIWLRLAEAYVDKSKAIEFRLQSEYDKELKDYQQGKTKKRPRLNLESANEYNQKAIQLYDWFIRDFPRDEKIDQALFFLGYNHFELGNVKVALNYYNELIKKYPQSEYIDESYFSIGEYYFENEQWTKAHPNYAAVTRSKSSKLYNFSLYKLAWCDFKLGRTRKALESLEVVISRSRTQSGGRIRLVDEAKMNIVPFYAELPDYRGAREYFTRILPVTEVDKYIERLAYYYVDTGKRKAARYYLNDLIERDPNSPKAYDYQYQIVTMYLTAGDVKTFKKELFSWIDKYGPMSRWAKISKNADLVDKSIKLVELTLRTFTLQQHQTSQNSRGEHSTELAIAGYEKYFSTFDKGEFAADMHFYYAELLFDQKKYQKAAVHYLWVADYAPTSQFYEKSILNALLALEKKLPEAEKIKKVVGNSNVPIPMDKATSIFSKVAEKYFETFPQSKNLSAIKYKLAALYAAYNFNDKAKKLFGEIVFSGTMNEFTENSGHTLLDIYNSEKDYGGLAEMAVKILDIPGVSKTPFGMQVQEILVQTSFKQAQVLGEEKKFIESAELYVNFANKFPTSNLLSAAIYNAAINFEKGGSAKKALGEYEKLMKQKGKDAAGFKEQSREFLASLYQNTGQYRNAAQAYESLARNEKNKNKRADYLYNAGILRKGLKHYNLAIKNIDSYYRIKSGHEAAEALFLIAQVWEARRNYKQATIYYSKYIDSNPGNKTNVIEATFRLGLLNISRKKYKEGADWLAKTIAVERRLRNEGFKGGIPFAAEAKFRLSYDYYLQLRKIEFTRDSKQQAKALDQKLKIFETLNSELKKVILYDDGYQIVAALMTIGQANQHMYASLSNLDAPKGLDADQAKVYKNAVKEKAAPFKDNAISSYTSGLEKASTFESYSKWVDVGMSELSRLSPEKYAYEKEFAFIAKLFDFYEDARKKSQVDPELLVRLETSVRNKDIDQSIELGSDALSKDYNDLYAINMLLIAYAQAGQTGIAKILADRMLKVSKRNPVALNNLGIVSLLEGDIREAIVYFRDAIKYAPTYEYAATNLGSIYIEYRDYGRAISPLEEGYGLTRSGLSEKNSVSVEVANNYALALKGLGKYKDSKKVFENIIESNDRNLYVLTNFAALLVNNLGEYDDAIKLISRVKVLGTDKEVLREIDRIEKRAYDEKYKK